MLGCVNIVDVLLIRVSEKLHIYTRADEVSKNRYDMSDEM